MRALHVLTDTGIGGAGRLLEGYVRASANRAEHIDSAGCANRNGLTGDNRRADRIETVVAVPRGAVIARAIEAAGARVVEVDGARENSADASSLRAYISLIRSLRPAAVVTHASAAAAVAAAICGVKRRILVRHCDGGGEGGPAARIYYRAVPTDFIATSSGARDALVRLGAPERRIAVIENGSERLIRVPGRREAVRASLGVGAGDFLYLYCGRLESVKGCGALLDAFALAAKQNGALRLAVVGGGSLDRALREQAVSLSIADKVAFTGFADDVSPFYDAADAVVLASVSETTPLSLSQGMSLGLPAAAFAVGGVPSMLGYDADDIGTAGVGGENAVGAVTGPDNASDINSAADVNRTAGLLAEPGDITALAAAMVRLCADRELYRSASKAAALRYESHYNIAVMAACWDDVVANGAQIVRQHP